MTLAHQTISLLVGYNRVDFLIDAIAQLRRFNRDYLISIDGPVGVKDVNQHLCQIFVENLLKEDDPRLKGVRISRENLGCKINMYQSLHWAAEYSSQFIVLEDDVRVNEFFFSFMDMMLSQHKLNSRVFAICGFTPLQDDSHKPLEIFLSRHFPAWGWATWIDRLEKFDIEMTSLNLENDVRTLPTLREFQLRDCFEKYWKRKLKRESMGFDTWDTQWLYSMWKLGCFSIVPTFSMVGNVGFADSRATHTKGIAKFNVELSNQPTHFAESANLYNAQTKFLNNLRPQLDHEMDRVLFQLFTKPGLRSWFMSLAKDAKRRFLTFL